MWIKRKVKPGSKTGQKIGFPTVNLNVGTFSYKPGVYKCTIWVKGKEYIGALYFGPKMHHRGNVLEIHILNFSRKIYGEFVRFEVDKKIRSPKQFTDLEQLKKQIEKDFQSIV
ncbi:riboflavin kinase [Patescibacteria group bacterium]|nr:riboflavin kinase [Patescibacteria group bacterium]